MTDRMGALERRKHTRIALKGAAILVAGEHAQRGRIANLGLGGILVATTVTAPDRVLGRTAELQLRLDGQRAQWLQAAGQITRITAESIAIAFDTPPPALVRVIDEMSTASRARLRIITVVLIDSDAARRTAMASGFRAVGCTVIETSTPLEAIVRLGEASFEPDLIAIADSIPGNTADELRRFVERDHPHTKLVTIGHELIEPTPSVIAHWLSSADPGSDLAARVRELLGRPRSR